MKRKMLTAGVCLLTFFLLKYPGESLAAAREGMSLWLNTLIPTLLPFLILTGILIHTDGIYKLLSRFTLLWKKLFCLSPYGAYALILGLLCGYPMGAKIACDLYSSGKISRREGEYLLTFTNNASPVFLLNYLGLQCLKGRINAAFILGILLLSDVLCMLFFRWVVYRNQIPELCPPAASKKETSSTSSPGAAIDVSIMNGFETITRLGGYILMFSILNAVISHFWPPAIPGKYLLLGLTEITTGLYQIALTSWPYQLKFICSMTLTAFGGFCIMAQTKSVLDKKLSLLPYASSKCLNALFTFILILVFRGFIH